MPSYFRHIVHFLLVAMMLMSITSCARWREAKAVIAEADRLLGEGVIMRDTAALADVIKALDNPIGRVIAREELVEAYYLMGRNLDDYCRDCATATDYYIEADRLKTKDPILRGRINSCMGFLCKQDSCFEEALEFYERANEAFEKSGDEKRIANGLLSIAERYIYLNEFAKVDSVLQEAATYYIDSAYHARLMDMHGFSLFRQQQYDSALTYLLSVKDYPRNVEAKCFNYIKIMHCYECLNQLIETASYAQYVISHSANPAYRSNAYFYLMANAKLQNDINNLSVYSHAREDEDRKLQHISEAYAQSAVKLKIYLQNPHPYRNLYILIFGGGIALLLLVALVYALHKRWRNTLECQDKERQNRRELFERKLFDHSVHFMCSDIWEDTNHLREKANNYCDNIFYRLEDTFHLREHEIMICLMVLMNFSRDKMAAYLHVLPNTISKSKNKIAKQLGTTSGDLREFWVDFMLS